MGAAWRISLNDTAVMRASTTVFGSVFAKLLIFLACCSIEEVSRVFFVKVRTYTNRKVLLICTVKMYITQPALSRLQHTGLTDTVKIMQINVKCQLIRTTTKDNQLLFSTLA